MILGNLLENVEVIKTTASNDIEVSGVCFDTRKLQKGDLFVAIKGYDVDGHKYIKEAVRLGASCVVCEDAPEVAVPYAVVSDTRKALALISAVWFGHPAKEIKLIGVTGTNGKTTVTTLLKDIIEKSTGKMAGLIGTSVNMIGHIPLPAMNTTPESYALHELLRSMIDLGCEYAVMEVSSHALALHRVYGIEFDVGIFTNLSQDHLDFHETMEKYAQAKAMLFAQSKKSAINIDDDYAKIMIDRVSGELFTYAVENSGADMVGKNVRLSSDKVKYCVLAADKLFRVELNIPGMFSVYNSLAVLSAASLLGLDIEVVAELLPSCLGVKGRAEVVATDRDYTIIIDYAHTPDALEKIITAVSAGAKGRVITLFGCGGDRDTTKRPIMGAIAAKLSDFVIVTSDNPRTEDPQKIIDQILLGMDDYKTPKQVIVSRHEAINWALSNGQKDDVIILAGKGHETYQVLGKEEIHFDEREVVAQWLLENKVK